MLVTPGLLSTSRWLLRERAKPTMKTGDKLGMQPPVEGRTSSHEKTRIVINVRENSSFSEVVGVLENTLIAEEGSEPGWILHLIFADGCLCRVLAFRRLQVRFQLTALLFEVRWILLPEGLKVAPKSILFLPQ